MAGLDERREPARVRTRGARGGGRGGRRARGRPPPSAWPCEDAALAEAQKRVQSLEYQLDDARRQAFANSTTVATLHNVIERAREAAERLSAELTRLDAEAERPAGRRAAR